MAHHAQACPFKEKGQAPTREASRRREGKSPKQSSAKKTTPSSLKVPPQRQDRIQEIPIDLLHGDPSPQNIIRPAAALTPKFNFRILISLIGLMIVD